jgi:predicted flavoprotein YhiN
MLKKWPGLYVVGEACDVDGRCGGYNLQWAFSSGFIAGTFASGKNR